MGPPQPADAALAAGVTARPQFARQTNAPVGVALGDEHGLHFLAQTGILLLARAGAAAPVVITAARHVQQGAEHRDPMIGGQLLEVRVAVVHGCERRPNEFLGCRAVR